jgi:hypothetical protein
MLGTVKTALEKEGLEEDCFTDWVGDEAAEGVESDILMEKKKEKRKEKKRKKGDVSLWGALIPRRNSNTLLINQYSLLLI